MKAIVIIPCRMAASRFPGKPLAPLHGMPMIGHCFHRSSLAEGFLDTYVATCDNEIVDYIEGINGKVLMTSGDHNRATTRTAEALEKIERQSGEQVDVVVMVQGDEPLISPKAIAETLQHFSDPSVQIVNIMSKLRTLEAFIDKNNVKVVVDQNNNALYFSREPIPTPRNGWKHIPCYMQTGIIAFRRDTLLRFNTLAETQLEQIESVDMNRVLEMGESIRMVSIEDFTIGVDTPEELVEAEKCLLNDPIVKSYLKS